MEALFGPGWERTTPQLSTGTSVQIAGLVEDSKKNGRRGFVLYRERIPKNCSIEAYIVHLYAQGTSLSDHVFVERRNLRLNDEVAMSASQQQPTPMQVELVEARNTIGQELAAGHIDFPEFQRRMQDVERAHFKDLSDTWSLKNHTFD